MVHRRGRPLGVLPHHARAFRELQHAIDSERKLIRTLPRLQVRLTSGERQSCRNLTTPQADELPRFHLTYTFRPISLAYVSHFDKRPPQHRVTLWRHPSGYVTESCLSIRLQFLVIGLRTDLSACASADFAQPPAGLNCQPRHPYSILCSSLCDE